MQRRKFLRLLGISPLTASAAAKSALSQTGYSVMDGVPSVGSLAPLLAPHGKAPFAQYLRDVLLRKQALPTWKLEKLKLEATQNWRGLDPDLASMQSVSVSAKIAEQRKRNLARLTAQAVQLGRIEYDRELWCSEYNVWWW